MVHEHPGVYSSYDASSVIGGKKTARILGAAAVSTTGTANEVVTLTSYAEGVSAFGEDAEGTVGMAALLAALYRNGAAVVKAVKVSAATPTGYEAAFAALEQALPQAEALICFGGDGTILHCAREATRCHVPILGINVGRRRSM